MRTGRIAASNSEAEESLKRHIQNLRDERDRLNVEIANTERSLQQLLAARGAARDRLIDVVKDWLLKNRSGTYVDIRGHIVAYAGVVIKGDLDHRLRQSLSRGVAGGTLVSASNNDVDSYSLSKKERERLKKLYANK